MIRTIAPERPSYLRVVRASAWYDLVVTAGFATPWTYTLVHDALSSSGNALGLGALPELDPVQILYANLMGSVVVVWAVLRIVRPLAVHGLLDGVARTLFAAWQSYALAHGATRLLWLFFGVEVMFGLVQLVPWCVQTCGGCGTASRVIRAAAAAPSRRSCRRGRSGCPTAP
ncbi:hypothetical protein OOK36_27320 [Streptomyces sp. NBC_00365]|uniref:hypothetical protein n=1 Tax=Streptomyces sp. NBC_00365 TaxID=2975726 RepID=UPI002250A799|nr:hypothetical protein [Streptomyces sp. NBC_00365]MCX5092524.1 hypothetical protein [Streptomyces sp. NBC_00365]